MFAVSGCRKQNSFSTSLVAAAVVVVAMDIHDGVCVCIVDGDDSGGGGGGGGGGVGGVSLSPRGTRRIVRFVGKRTTDHNTTTVRRHRGMELPDIVKDFSTVDLNGNEDKILRSDC